MDLVIKNCRLVDKTGEYFIKVTDGKITDISKTPIEASESIDIKNNFILPGFIDPHIHFRDPGLTQKENFKTLLERRNIFRRVIKVRRRQFRSEIEDCVARIETKKQVKLQRHPLENKFARRRGCHQ